MNHLIFKKTKIINKIYRSKMDNLLKLNQYKFLNPFNNNYKYLIHYKLIIIIYNPYQIMLQNKRKKLSKNNKMLT